MKRLFSLLLALAMILSLCACGGTSPEKTLEGKWACVEGPESFSFEFDKNGTGTFYIDVKSADVTWEYEDSETYEKEETKEKHTIYSYTLRWDGRAIPLVTEAGGEEELMMKVDDYTLLFEKE